MNIYKILIYQNTKGDIKLDVRLEEETVWLSQAQMGMLFNENKRTNLSTLAISKKDELYKHSFVLNFRITANKSEGFICL
jgi:hypothetical protein